MTRIVVWAVAWRDRDGKQWDIMRDDGVPVTFDDKRFAQRRADTQSDLFPWCLYMPIPLEGEPPASADGYSKEERMPERIQLRRTKGWRKPEGCVSVARPTAWGNPFQIDGKYLFDHVAKGFVALNGRDPREVAVEMHRDWILHHAPMTRAALPNLRGLDLACWCPLDVPCHADTLLELANPRPAIVDCWSCDGEATLSETQVEPSDGYCDACWSKRLARGAD